jgi:isochorismate synthase EntC
VSTGAGGWEAEFLGGGAYVELGGGAVLVAWGDCAVAASPGEGGASFYVPDFFLKEPLPWRVFTHYRIVDSGEIARSLGAGVIPDFEWEGPREDAFGLLVDRALDRITGGEIEKAVPTAAMASGADIPKGALSGLVSRSLRRGDGGLAYGFWRGGEGIVGVTPERLFCREGGMFRIDAVAGTGFATGARTGVWEPSPKDLLEHAVVLRDIAEVCRRVSDDGAVRVGGTSATRIGPLWHLKAVVEFDSPLPSGFPSLISRLHPTPALGISPRGNWRRVCRQLDDGERWRHGAPFGFQVGGNSLEGCLVALRCLQWREGGGMQIRAGCGVVRGSSPGAEYRELLAKFSAVRRTLGI